MSLLEVCLGLDEYAVQGLHDMVKAGWRLMGARALAAGDAHPLLDHCGGGIAIYLFEDRRGVTRAPELEGSDGTALGHPRLPIAGPAAEA